MEQTDNISLEPLSPIQQFAMNRVFFEGESLWNKQITFHWNHFHLYSNLQ